MKTVRITKDKKILIVGLGLIGGSYAQALTDSGYEVGAVDNSKDSIEFAVKKGIISHGIYEIDTDYISKFDIVVFSLYPKVFLNWIKENQHCLKENALLTDVTGVKCPIIFEIQKILRKDLEFIGAHPMAGKEVYGVKNADKDIFKDANYIVTPTDKNSQEAIETCKELGNILGFRSVSILSPSEHDEMIGFLSQLTHCIAVCLMTCKDSHHLVDYTGDSFRDLTRIAKINEYMWTELFLLNKEELLAQMDLFSDNFSLMRNAIADENIDEIYKLMRLSTERRKYFDVNKGDNNE